MLTAGCVRVIGKRLEGKGGCFQVPLIFVQTGAVNAILDASRHVFLCVICTFVVNLDEFQCKAVFE